MTRLSLERIAARLQSLREQGDEDARALLSQPRYVESICFLEAMSHQPGGLENFWEDFKAFSPRWFAELPLTKTPTYLDDPASGPQKIGDSEALYRIRAACETFDRGFFGCNSLKRTCGPVLGFFDFDHHFPGFLAELAGYMDHWAETELAKTADTSLRRKVILELDFARASSIPVTLVADTRHGKTTAVETYCRAWPGRARLVTLPDLNREREFYAAYAEAFHLPVTPATKRDWIRERVQYIVRQVGVFCVHDEAHRVIPTTYHEGTPPPRLEWIRSQLIDRKIPCAFFCTPQSQQETLARYASKTHYNLEQWIGRMPAPVVLSDRPNRDDLAAVAKNRFPEFPVEILQILCTAAETKCALDYEGRNSAGRMNGESGYKIIEHAGARARFLAREKGLRAVDRVVIWEAIEWAGVPLPKRQAALNGGAQATRASAPAKVSQGRRGCPAEAPQGDVPTEFPARGIAPAVSA